MSDILEKVHPNRRIVQEVVEQLVLGQVEISEFKSLCQQLDKTTYSNVQEERFLAGVCGYALCSEVPQRSLRQRFVIRQQGIYNVESRKWFCSDECFTASVKILSQLPDEPLWISGPRTLFNIVVVSDDDEQSADDPSVTKQHQVWPGEPVFEVDKMSRELQKIGDVCKSGLKKSKKGSANVWQKGNERPAPAFRVATDLCLPDDDTSSDESNTPEDEGISSDNESEDELIIDPVDVHKRASVDLNLSRSSIRPAPVNSSIGCSDSSRSDETKISQPNAALAHASTIQSNYSQGAMRTEDTESQKPKEVVSMPLIVAMEVDDDDGRRVCSGEPSDEALDRIRQRYFQVEKGRCVIPKPSPVTIIEPKPIKPMKKLQASPSYKVETGHSLLQKAAKRLESWLTEDSLRFILGDQLGCHQGKCATAPVQAVEEMEPTDNSADSTDVAFEKLGLSKENLEYAKKVAAFFRGSTTIPNEEDCGSVALPGTSRSNTGEAMPERSLPLVDSIDQRSHRWNIVLERLVGFWPTVFAAIGHECRGFKERLNTLVRTFNLTAENVILQGTMRSNMAVLLLCSLAIGDPELRETITTEQAVEFFSDEWGIDVMRAGELVDAIVGRRRNN